MKNFKIRLALALAVALFISSCSKETSEVVTEETTVRLNIGQAYAKTDPVKTASVGRSYASAVQTVEIPFDNEYTLIATLAPEASSSVNSLKATNRAATTSTGNSEQVLKQGTVYYVAIFDATGKYKETKSFTQGAGAQDFAIDKGKYTFVIYASGTNKTLPTIPAGATLSTVKFENLTADKDFMLDQVAIEVKNGENLINADLDHLFTQVRLKFDTSDIGAVSSIVGATITPSNPNVDVALIDGALTYKGTSAPVSFNLPNKTGKMILSDSTFITTATTAAGTIALTGVSIDGSVAKNISKGGWNLRPGVKYTLEITLKKPISVNIGGKVWALGNLTYSNGVYGFAQTNDTYGNYWFPGFQIPKVLDGSVNNQKPSTAINGGAVDPCSLVLPLNTWRLPTKAEFDKLKIDTDQGGIDNPIKTGQPNAQNPARWVDTYDGTAGTNLGMFFGTVGNPGTDRYKKFYLPYGGSYNDNNTGDAFGTQGLYLLANKQRLQLTGSKNTLGWSINTAAAEPNFALQIRCIKQGL
ncbi:hypothetical protein [Sphingobacterium sp. UDSM-2020]|uniref:hypothetical protein n=1 Tax=Sphingobacterium sp. UDSM-2020 TaxID=2795738 RepID=UPI001937CF50|nr:hypothetical protein [Sphingobacterium sp. UDSM-2020]QQD15533.1 hypothetical protein JAZ75_08475 [Sphingobacterium sp. UDSM-2020]